MSAWKNVALGEVATIEREVVEASAVRDGTFYVGLENIQPGGDCADVREVAGGELASSKFAFTPRHLLYGKLRPYLAKIARPQFAGICSTDILPVLPGRVLDRDYVAHFLLRPESIALAASRATGANLPRLSPRALAEIRVPLPPLAEQRRIAEVLDRADALRAKRRAAIAHLDALARSVFLDMFGDPAGNPAGWPRRTVGELCHVKGGKRLPKGEEYSGVPTPYRYIRVVDLKAGAVAEGGLVFLKPDVQARIARYVVSEGDVIISIAGSVGLIAPVTRSLHGANLTENAAKLVPRRVGEYEAGFLALLLQTPFAQRQIGSHVGQVTIGKLALFRIERLRVPMPPIGLQREFSHRVEAIELLKSAHRASLVQLDALFASLQYRAFRGGL